MKKNPYCCGANVVLGINCGNLSPAFKFGDSNLHYFEIKFFFRLLKNLAGSKKKSINRTY